jgi:ferredoxin-NADP reductase
MFMVAGPPGMTEAVQKALEAAGVHEEHVTAERFSGY